jgi:hypothetical protein
MSCSTGVSIDLTVLNLVTATVGPIANAFGTAPAPYNVTTTLVSLNSTSNLSLGSLAVTTGLITDTAASTYTGTNSPASTATSTVNNLGLNLAIPVAGSLLMIDATTLTSTSSASRSGTGPITLTGSSEIEDLAISGLGLNAVTLNATALAATPANDDLLSVLGLNVIANYQTPIYVNGTDKTGIQTAALAIQFNNFALGTGALNGTILIADSAASVPEPATWGMMIVGLVAIGFGARRRRKVSVGYA